MSFILDALKKSEADRQRQGAPGIASIPESGRREPGPRWIWIIMALLAVNLAVLLGIVFKPGGDHSAAEAVQTPPPRLTSSTQLIEPAPQAVTGTIENTRAETTETVVEQAAAAPLPATTPTPRQTVTEGLKTFGELRAGGMLQLPDMHIDIHVYSGQPADRFVFVNMRKYRESATLIEGPVVSEITPDGVVLNYQGLQFLLPRE